MDILTYLPGFILIALLILFYQRIFKNSIIYRYFWIGLALKVIAGIFLGWLYFNYYKAGDTISYFQDASLLRTLFIEDFSAYLSFLLSDSLPEQYLSQITYYTSSPRALFFTKIISILNIAFFNLANY